MKVEKFNNNNWAEKREVYAGNIMKLMNQVTEFKRSYTQESVPT